MRYCRAEELLALGEDLISGRAVVRRRGVIEGGNRRKRDVIVKRRLVMSGLREVTEAGKGGVGGRKQPPANEALH